MKITKTVKYNYKLTEETLEKDIDRFISDARKGIFEWDSKYGGEAIKIIKQYFKFIQEKYEEKEFEECKNCYHKLILFLFASSTGRDDADFGYEDLLAKISKDFNKFINNYFISVVKTCEIDELTDKVSEYAIALKEYGFDSDKKILIKYLERDKLDNLINLLLLKTEGMTKGEEGKHDIIYFLMEIFEELEEKENYLNLCKRFEGVLSEKEVEYLRGEYEGNRNESLWENKTKINGVWVDDDFGKGGVGG